MWKKHIELQTCVVCDRLEIRNVLPILYLSIKLFDQLHQPLIFPNVFRFTGSWICAGINLGHRNFVCCLLRFQAFYELENAWVNTKCFSHLIVSALAMIVRSWTLYSKTQQWGERKIKWITYVIWIFPHAMRRTVKTSKNRRKQKQFSMYLANISWFLL